MKMTTKWYIMVVEEDILSKHLKKNRKRRDLVDDDVHGYNSARREPVEHEMCIATIAQG